jgi:hypothetical protein
MKKLKFEYSKFQMSKISVGKVEKCQLFSDMEMA